MKPINNDYKIKLVFEKGKKFYTNNLIFFIFNNINSNDYAIIISKKIGKAYLRNRLRRIIKPNLLKYFIKNNNFSIIILPKKKSIKYLKSLKLENIENDFKFFLKKIREI